MVAEDLRKAFQLFDVDGNGAIDKGELGQLLCSMWSQPNAPIRELEQDEIDALFDEADLDKNGEIDFDEFVNIAAGASRIAH